MTNDKYQQGSQQQLTRMHEYAPKILVDRVSGSPGPQKEQNAFAATEEKPSAAAVAGGTGGADGLTGCGVEPTPEMAAEGQQLVQ